MREFYPAKTPQLNEKRMDRNIKILIFVMVIVFILVIALASQLNYVVKESIKDESNPNKKCPRRLSDIVTLTDDNMNFTRRLAARFPYVAAVTTNSSNSVWSFACFASVILVKWIVTSAHCRCK